MRSRARPVRIATSQFPITGDIARNARYIGDYIRRAAAGEAAIVQFPETALSGYPGSDLRSVKDLDWDTLRRETARIQETAARHRIWVLLGSSHFVSDSVKPTNCVYVISPQGVIINRYDKSMLTPSDARNYTPGNRRVTFRLNGITCGVLICKDHSFPEMYNVYRHMGVKLMFHSFYNARLRGRTCLDQITPAHILARASDNGMWVVAANACGHYQAWATRVASPDGTVCCQLKRHVPGVLFFDLTRELLHGWGPGWKHWKTSWVHNGKMMKCPADEVYCSGRPSRHPRIVEGTCVP
jgi:predicted amidohydrolase